MTSVKNAFVARTALVALALTAALVSPLKADESDEIRQLREEIQLLEKKLSALEQREQQRDDAAKQPPPTASSTAPQATQAAPSAKITIDDTGFSFASADALTYINLHGLVQADTRWFFDNHGLANNNTFVIRRARLIYEGAFDKIFSYQIVPEFGGGGSGTSNSPVLYDANLGVAVSSGLQFKVGKFKSPIGLEMLQNDAVLLFDERSLATDLVPARDVGAEALGSFLDKRVSYAAGVFNGSADNTYASNTDGDNNKDFDARVFLTPFVNDTASALQNLGFGIAGSTGIQNKTGSLTTGYKTDGQQTFFTYRSTVLPQGVDWRVSPQANYYNGPFSAQAEYTESAVTALAGTAKKELKNKAWQVAAGYVITGEKQSYNGLTPANNFNWANGTWGAFEVGARVADLKIDTNAFPIFADPAASASEATSYGLSGNWYLSRAIRISLDLVQTHFDRVPGTKTTTNLLIGQDEQAILTRFQVGF